SEGTAGDDLPQHRHQPGDHRLQPPQPAARAGAGRAGHGRAGLRRQAAIIEAANGGLRSPVSRARGIQFQERIRGRGTFRGPIPAAARVETMPIHDWTRVNAGTFHDFHHEWISTLKRALNGGLLPADYYAMAEQIAGGLHPDVLTLEGSPAEPRGAGP